MICESFKWYVAFFEYNLMIVNLTILPMKLRTYPVNLLTQFLVQKSNGISIMSFNIPSLFFCEIS
jgi:hypothetical protein